MLQRVAGIRAAIKAQARERGWAVTDAQLDDRHIVRRMILKKAIFGVDRPQWPWSWPGRSMGCTPSPWARRCPFSGSPPAGGDGLHGERLPTVQRGLQQLGALLLQSEFDRLGRAARNLAQVANLTDVDIAEARLSKELAEAAAADMAPLQAVLDFSGARCAG